MKVAFCMSKHFYETAGGGRVQVLKTKQYLELLDKSIEIVVIHDPTLIDSSYEVCHVFNMADLDVTLAFILAAKKLGIKTCLSTVYWDYNYLILTGMFSRLFGFDYTEWMYKLERLLGKFAAFLFKRPEYSTKRQKEKYANIVKEVDFLLPNSMEEGIKLLEYTCQKKEKYIKKIVPIVNSVDVNLSVDKPEDFSLEGYVLEVGRIEPCKNQLKVVKALNNLDIPIVFLGHDYFPESKYSKRLHEIAKKRGNVFFFDQIPYEQVHTFYEKASVHILPSLRESPGLVSLEALLNKCKIVVADERFVPVKAYCFDNFATIINPLSSKSIREGILKEISVERDFDKISSYIKEHFNWGETAKQTYSAYNMKKMVYNGI